MLIRVRFPLMSILASIFFTVILRGMDMGRDWGPENEERQREDANHFQLEAKTDNYIKSVVAANELIHSDLFRPPHGKIKRSELKKLKT